MPTHQHIDVAQRGIRWEICTQCFNRPAGSEALGPHEPRACEPWCAIFHHLPKLMRIVHTVHASTLADYQHAIKDEICQFCDLSDTAGDYCAKRTMESCPLARYGGEVIDILERVQQARQSRRAAS